MNKRIIVIVLLLAVFSAGTIFFMLSKNSEDRLKNNKNQASNTTLESNFTQNEIIDEPAKAALLAALDDEYKAYTTYKEIINKFGDVRPFSMIIKAEEKHINSLIPLLQKYEIEIPENKYLNNIKIPDTLKESCQAGVEAEIENANLYKSELLPMVKNYLDITLVFNNLMSASENNHLPAFENCAR